MSYDNPIVEWVTYYRTVSRTFESYEAPPASDDGVRTRWFIMQIDTVPTDPYDWIAASIDFTFDQGSYIVGRNRDDVVGQITKYVMSHAPSPNQPLFVDQLKQPWLVARCNGCLGSGKYGMAMTAAYDGVVVYPATHPTLAPFINERTPAAAKAYAKAWVTALATKAVPPPPEMAPFDKAKIAGAGPGGTPGPDDPVGPVGPGGVPVPPPPPPLPPTPTNDAGAAAAASPLLLVGVSAAAAYWFTRSRGPAPK